MSYFDDPKNKAKWDKELAALKQEKERRKNGAAPAAVQSDLEISEEKSVNMDIREPEKAPVAESAGATAAPEAAASWDGTRVRISYYQLLEEEKMAQAKKTAPAHERQLQKEAVREL